MVTAYTVKRGDCIASIAYANGLPPDKLWNAPENAELRERRKNPSTLSEGDVVQVKEREPKWAPAATDARYRFLRVGVPELLRIRFIDEEFRPRSGVQYTLIVDGGTKETGVTDGNGAIRVPIAPNAKVATLVLSPDGDKKNETYELALGELQRATVEEALLERLERLGFGVEDELYEDAELQERIALKMFQSAQGLPVTGEADQATLDALEAFHGS